MQRVRFSKIAGFTATVLMAIELMGCGAQEKQVTSISLDKNGKITNTIYEEFGEEHYDIQELTKMAENEISAYNSECLREKIFLESVDSVSDGAYVKMIITYETPGDYSGFNKTSLFYGTVQDALDRGYNFSNDLIDENGLKISQDAIDANLDNHVIITNDKSVIIAPYNILYTSEGIILDGKKEAILSSSSSDEVQLILSK